MFRLVSPLWLAGLAALAVPLALHLWNRRPTRVVRIGSLDGLAGPPGPRALGRRLDDIPLLLLRLAILAAVVIGLAGPLLSRENPAAPIESGVVLVDPTLLRDSLAVFSDPMVDSLRRAGQPIHLLAPGFPRLGDHVTPATHRRPIWPLLRELDDTLPAGTPVIVLGRPVAGSLGPVRPRLSARVEFHDLAGTVLAATNDLFSTTPHPPKLAVQSGDSIFIEVVVGKGFEDESQAAVAAWTSAVEGWLGAKVKSLVRDISDNDGSISDDRRADIVIWLASQSAPGALIDLVAGGAILVEINPSEPHALSDGRISVSGTGGASPDQLRGWVTLRGPTPPGAPLLADGSGSPLLTVTNHGLGRHYRLATRWAAEWSTLAAGSDLPEIALVTLRGEVTGGEAAMVHPGQAGPRGAGSDAAGRTRWQALAAAAWGLAALLLLVERLTVHRRWMVAA